MTITILAILNVLQFCCLSLCKTGCAVIIKVVLWTLLFFYIYNNILELYLIVIITVPGENGPLDL